MKLIKNNNPSFFQHKRLTEKQLREYIGFFGTSMKHHWEDIARYQSLSESFIEEFKDELDWDFISEYQCLSEDFIRKFEFKVAWDYISLYQTLSKDFLLEFKDDIDWVEILQKYVFDEDFLMNIKDILIGIDKNTKHSIKRILAENQKFSPAFAVELEMFHYVWNINENPNFTLEEKQEIIDTLKMVNKMTV